MIDSEGYVVSSYLDNPSVTNRVPHPILVDDVSLDQSTLEHSEIATYSITFTPINPMSATGSIQITYPS